MTLSTPYLIYIIEAYGVSLVGLILFFYMTFRQWRKVKKVVR